MQSDIKVLHERPRVSPIFELLEDRFCHENKFQHQIWIPDWHYHPSCPGLLSSFPYNLDMQIKNIVSQLSPTNQSGPTGPQILMIW